MNYKQAERAVLCGSDGSEAFWNPFALGKVANQLLLLHFKFWRLIGFSAEFSWALTEKAESVFVFVRSLGRAA